ncbi:MAG: hypothetical protein KDJ29_20475 [Hyphomicrobiales bacterium]|nr:hypothetical protein [Hyphomicrobiales bacterium]
MTLDQLIFNYELAKTNAARSGSLEDRKTYFDLVGYYEKRIRAARTKAVPILDRHATGPASIGKAPIA